MICPLRRCCCIENWSEKNVGIQRIVYFKKKTRFSALHRFPFKPIRDRAQWHLAGFTHVSHPAFVLRPTLQSFTRWEQYIVSTKQYTFSFINDLKTGQSILNAKKIPSKSKQLFIGYICRAARAAPRWSHLQPDKGFGKFESFT
jgi:hypothetical protein